MILILLIFVASVFA